MPPSPSGSSGRKLVPPTDKIPMEDKPSKQKAAKVPTAEKKARGSTEAGKKVMDYAKSVLAKDARPMEVDVHRMNRELQKMTVPQLKGLQKQFMGKHGGKVKADRVKSLVDLVSGRVKVQVPKVDRGTGRQGLEQKATLWSDVKDAFRHLMRGGDVFGNAKADEPQAADSLTTAEVIATLLQLRADGDNVGAGKLVRLIESYTDAPEEDADSEEPPTDNRKRRKKGKSSIPSRGLDMTPDKACKILKDGTVHGKPLTSRQRGMFGAKCGERGPKRNSVTVPSLVRSRP